MTAPSAATTPALSDEELAVRAQRGCAASFEQLVRRLQVPLLRFLRRFAGHEDAEDLVQESFVRAYENLHRYRTTWRFQTWLFTVARRLSINLHRRKRPTADSEILESMPGDGLPAPQIVVREESRRSLWNLAEAVLTEQQMTALWLYYVEEMAVKQIAHVLGSSRGAVKGVLFRARQKLLPYCRELAPGSSGIAGSSHPSTMVCHASKECSHG